MYDWDQLLDDFIFDHGGDWKSVTRAWYRQRLLPFMAHLAELSLDRPSEIGIRDVRRFLGRQRDLVEAGKLATTTLNGMHTALGKFFAWLKADGHIKTNIFAEARLRRPRPPSRPPRDIPLRYIERIVAAAEAETSSVAIRDAAMMRLLISTGMRRVELVSLLLDDLDLVEGTARITGKFGKQRYAFPDVPAQLAVKQWLVVRPEMGARELFVTLRGTAQVPLGSPMRADNVNERLAYWRDWAGIPSTISVSPHKWRHTFATLFIENGGDTISLARLLGHRQTQTTEIYVTSARRVLKKKALEFAPKIGRTGADSS